MKKLACEMCGGIDLIKKDGVFVCEHCGMKYSAEEAKKMMIDGTVEVQGTVKVDSSNELKNLYQAARNAREAGDYETAQRHYERISTLDPDSWEAVFYTVILRKCHLTNGQIESFANGVNNSLEKVFRLIAKNVENEDEKKGAVKDVCGELIVLSQSLTGASYSFYKACMKGNGVRAVTGGVLGAISSVGHLGDEITKDKDRRTAIVNFMYCAANCIEALFDMTDAQYKNYAIVMWKKCLELDDSCKADHGSTMLSSEGVKVIKDTIRKYDPSYGSAEKEAENAEKTESEKTDEAKEEKKDGCYVATAVYGSYDCPQVWTLRRFRDNELAKSRLGRAFIIMYYAISPTLVKWFGETSWFRRMWRGRLDSLVESLQSKGVESTPYNDINWR